MVKKSCIFCLNLIDISLLLTESPPRWPNYLPLIHLFSNILSRGHKSCNNHPFWIKTALQIKSCQNRIFYFFLSTCHGYVWKFYQLFLVSTFSITNWDTLVQILGHDSHNKYSFEATYEVRNFMFTLLYSALFLSFMFNVYGLTFLSFTLLWSWIVENYYFLMEGRRETKVEKTHKKERTTEMKYKKRN